MNGSAFNSYSIFSKYKGFEHFMNFSLVLQSPDSSARHPSLGELCLRTLPRELVIEM